jgi:hypothetical protein
VTSEGNEVHVAMVAGLKADCGTRWDVEPLSAVCIAIKLQGCIRLSEVKV